MKQEILELDLALLKLTSEMKGKVLGRKQSEQVANMIEQFLVDLRYHIDSKNDTNGIYCIQRAEMELDRVQMAGAVDIQTQTAYDAFKDAMKSVTTPGDLKWNQP